MARKKKKKKNPQKDRKGITHMGVLKMWDPQSPWVQGQNGLILDDLEYPHFRKPTFIYIYIYVIHTCTYIYIIYIYTHNMCIYICIYDIPTYSLKPWHQRGPKIEFHLHGRDIKSKGVLSRLEAFKPSQSILLSMCCLSVCTSRLQ